MLPAFNIQLGQQIQPGLVAVGKFDGARPSLACGTTGGRVLLHSPHEGSSAGAEGQLPTIRYLNFNKQITALAAGSLSGNAGDRDVLFIGTQSNLTAYDVERNAEIFFREVQDGVNTLQFGRMHEGSAPLVIAGGNCSVYGFDRDGAEKFWTVTGDNVSSLALVPRPNASVAGMKDLLVGSDDFEVRVFHNEELTSEITEADKVTFLCPLNGSSFAYGLANGTIGVYNEAKQRVWRVKAKHSVTALHAYDLDCDGVKEVVSGWSNGAVIVRRATTGEIIFKDMMKSPIASITTSDYRMDGKELLMICSESGELRAFLGTDVDLQAAANAAGAGAAAVSGEQRILSDLHAQKQELIAQLRMLEKSLKSAKTGELGVGALPPNTTMTYTLSADAASGLIYIRVESSTDVHLHTIIAFDTEGALLAGNEVLIAFPATSSKSGIVSFRPTKTTAAKLKVQAHASIRGHTELMHVFENDVSIPKFAAFQHVGDRSDGPKPSAEVNFTLPVGCKKVEEWLRSSFLLDKSINIVSQDGQSIKAHFIALNPQSSLLGSPVQIFAKSSGLQQLSEVRLRLSSIELAGEIVQDIASALNVNELESMSEFPDEIAALREVVARVTELSAARTQLQADMADDSQRVKALIVRAEDSRLLTEMESMRRAYTELYSLNNQLVGAYNTRAANHEALLAALKEVNLAIQRASNLRVGVAKTKLVTSARAAVKANNMEGLLKVLSGL